MHSTDGELCLRRDIGNSEEIRQIGTHRVDQTSFSKHGNALESENISALEIRKGLQWYLRERMQSVPTARSFYEVFVSRNTISHCLIWEID